MPAQREHALAFIDACQVMSFPYDPGNGGDVGRAGMTNVKARWRPDALHVEQRPLLPADRIAPPCR